MNNLSRQQALQQICRLLEAPRLQEVSDRQLLDRFLQSQDGEAFSLLLQRHGAMILHVCRRVLPRSHDAEDVFQATFLLLVRKADSIRCRESVASWLYGVAYRLAVQLKRQGERRELRERRAGTVNTQEPGFDAAWRELQKVLDEEIGRLPDKYRSPLLLCYFEGKTHEEAARDLGWPVGTVRGRLARARDCLRERLGRRGLSLSVAALATVLGGGRADALVPASLHGNTLNAALQLAAGNPAAGLVSAQAARILENAMRSAVVTKVRLALLLALSTASALALVGTLSWSSVTAQPPPARGTGPVAAPKEGDPRKEAVDALGDPLPPGAYARLGTSRLTQAGAAYQLASFTLDGQWVAVATYNSGVVAWDTKTGKEVARYAPEAAPGQQQRGMVGFALTPDRNRLVLADGFSGLSVRDLKTGKEVSRITVQGGLGNTAFAVSPDSKLVATCSRDKKVHVWDIETGKEKAALEGHLLTAEGVLFTPDSKGLFSCSGDTTIRLWDLAEQKEVRRFEGHRQQIRGLALSHDHKTLASAGADGTIRLWDPSTGKQIRSWRYEGNLTFGGQASLAFTPDDKKLTLGSQGAVQVWDVSNGEEVRSTSLISRAYLPVQVSPDGRLTLEAVYGRRMRLCDAVTGKEVLRFDGHQGPVGGIAFSPDGRMLASGGADETVRLWDTTNGKELRKLEGHSGTVNFLSFSPDGKRLVTASGDRDLVVSIWEVETGKEIRQLRGHLTVLGAVEFFPDGKRILAVQRNNQAVIWDAETGKKIRDLEKVGLPASLSPDGKLLAATQGPVGGAQPQTIALVSTDSGEVVRTLTDETKDKPDPMDFARYGQFDGITFTPDGKTVLTTAPQRGMEAWDVQTGQRLRQVTPKPTVQGGVYYGVSRRAVVTPDGRAIFQPGVDKLALHEFRSGQLRREIRTGQGVTPFVAMSRDGKLLATASQDSTILLWRTDRLPRPKPDQGELTGKALDKLWEDLGSADGPTVEKAIQALASGKETLAYLGKKVAPVDPKVQEQIGKLVADLADKKFETRKNAETELGRLGEMARPALERALKDKPSLDVTKRLEGLIQQLKDGKLTPEQTRALRAVEVYEEAGTSEAKKALEELSKGATDAPLTIEARAALARLK